MRIARRKLLKISAASLLLTAGVLWVFRDSLKVHYHLGALRNAEKKMFAPPPSTFPQQVTAFLFRRPPREGWLELYSRHEEALVRIGYFARGEFPLKNQQITAVQLSTNAQRRFRSQFSSLMVITNGQRLSSTTMASNSCARIIAPATEMDDWSALILELDGGRL